MKLTLLLFLAAISIVGAVTPPAFNHDAIAPYYEAFTGKSMPLMGRSVVGEPARRFVRDSTPVPVLLNIARTLCGPGPKVFLNDIQTNFPSFWQESRGPSTFEAAFRLPDENLLPGELFLTASGTFNTTAVCNAQNGCFLLVRKSTDVTIVPFNVTLPTEFDTAVFVFSHEPRSACGVDDALIDVGFFANSSVQLGRVPIFNNVLNLQGVLTADTFSTADINSGPGGDAGWGSNKYLAIKNITDRTYQNIIISSFDSPDPSTGLPVFLGRQITINQGQIGNAPF
jgi:hypothetical protein